MGHGQDQEFTEKSVVGFHRKSWNFLSSLCTKQQGRTTKLFERQKKLFHGPLTVLCTAGVRWGSGSPHRALSLSLLRFHCRDVHQLPVARGLQPAWPSWAVPSPAPRLSTQPQRCTCSHTCREVAAVSGTGVAMTTARTGTCPRGESFRAVLNPSTPAGGSPVHPPPDPADPHPQE